jgi:Flp pilus assembly protein TadG
MSKPTTERPRRLVIRRRRRSRGQSLVEFAIILPVFLLLFAAILDLGRIAAARISVTNAAREGAFQAAQTPTSYVAGGACNTTTNLVVCRTQLEAKGSGVTIAPADIAMSCDPDCTPAVGSTVTVSVTGHFQLLTTILSSFFGGNQSLAFSASSTNQLEILPAVPAGASPTPSPSPSPSPDPSVSPSPSPSPTPTPACIPPSAGFTHTENPADLHKPVTISVVDTSLPSAPCITDWKWTWGDGYISYGEVPGPHTYQNVGSYEVTLTVTGPGGTNTSGAVTIKVKG